MQTTITQVAPEPWPSGYGEIIAMLDVAPETLADRFCLAFYEGTDNLGDYHAAVVRLPSGRRVGLLRHVGDPLPGTELHADHRDDPCEVRREALEAMHLSPGIVSWMRKPHPAGIQQPVSTGLR